MTDYSSAQWRKSSYSMCTGNCVEFSQLPGGEVALRDSKDQRGPAISFSPGAWGAFVSGLKAAEFDLRP
jgi:Domain of unknown function (DUF397)